MLTGTKLSLPWAPGNWTLTTSSHFYHPKAYPFPVPNSSLSPQTRCCAWLLSRVQLFVTPWTAALQAPLSMGILQARILEWVAMPPSRDLPNPGIEPRSPALQADSLPAELQAKPKNTGVGTLSLLQRIFLSQESNRGLLHCRWILYQLSYQGGPNKLGKMVKNIISYFWFANKIIYIPFL